MLPTTSCSSPSDRTTDTTWWNGKLEDCLIFFVFFHWHCVVFDLYLACLQDTSITRIASGAETQIFLMEHKRKKIKCAVKKILKPTQIEIELGKTWKEDWMTDVAKLATLKSPFIVQIYDAFEDEDAAYIVMEYSSKGDLRVLMSQRQKSGRPFAESVSVTSNTPSSLYIPSSPSLLFRKFSLTQHNSSRR
jgi:serine/threonine protein kinase